MDIPPEILEVLKCNSCETYLSRGPVYLQHDGVAACGRCYTSKRPATRNTFYEATARLLKFPCKYRELGCLETVPYVDQDDVIEHEEVCEHRDYVCPVLGSARCDWLGRRATMLAHCSEEHPDSVLENPCSLTHDIAKAETHNYLIAAFQVLFLLHTKVCVATGKIFHAVRLLGTSANAANYFFNLDIKRNNEQLSKEGQVAPQGCLAIQEPTSLAVNTNSLLDMLGGFDGATFTITVKQRMTDVALQLVKVVLDKCVGCAADVTEFRYRSEGGWRCARCAPAKRTCKNRSRGCTHSDIDDKCVNHELYFCEKSIMCFICWKILSDVPLSMHYAAMHQGITYVSGSTWRATKTGFLVGRHCLLTCVEGTAVCHYRLRSSTLVLIVRMAVPSERFSEFRCEVRVTNPVTGHARSFVPDVRYNATEDWLIQVKKEEFPSWNSEFDVCVDIQKAVS